MRTGAAPQVLAAWRRTALAALRQAGSTNVAASLRAIGGQAGAALQLLGWSPA